MKDKIEVTESFYDIYRRFNVNLQIDNMKTLTQRELYLLLVLCLDKFQPEDITVKNNLIPFKNEIMLLNDIFNDKKSTEQVILDLIEETGDEYIKTSILSYNGECLPDPYTISEIRDLRINDLIN